MTDVSENHEPTESTLQEADLIAQNQLLKPSSLEKSAIKNYCNLVLQKRQLETSFKEQCKPWREAAKNAKKELFEILKASEEKTLTWSKPKMAEMDQPCAAEGLSSMPPQLRFVTASKDSPLKAEMLQEILQNLSQEDIDEVKTLDAEKDPKAKRPFREILHDAVLLKLRQMIRSVTESIRLSQSLERGRKFHEVPDRDDLADKALLWHMNEERIKKARAVLKENMGDLSSQIKEAEEAVDAFFVRTQTTSRQLTLDNKNQRLMRKVTSKKSRVGVTTVGPWITESFDLFKVDSFRNFQKAQAQILKDLESRLDTVPITTKSSVSLVVMKNQSSD